MEMEYIDCINQTVKSRSHVIASATVRKLVGFCHSPVDIRASAHAGVSADRRRGERR